MENFATGLMKRAMGLLRGTRYGFNRTLGFRWRLHPLAVDHLKRQSLSYTFTSMFDWTRYEHTPSELPATLFGLPVVEDNGMDPDEVRLEVSA